MKKKILYILGIIYLILVIVTTILLLNRNEYGVFETKNNYYLCNDNIIEYSDTSLVRFAKNVKKEDLISKEVYYLNDENYLKRGILDSFDEEKFTIDKKEFQDCKRVLGIPDKEYRVIGALANYFTNRYVYLLFIILPVIVLLMYEGYLLIGYFRKKQK